MRVCKKCSINKAESEYYFTDKQRAYLDSVCKECRRAEQRARNRETPEQRRERQASKVYKTHDPEYRRKYYEENREAILAKDKKRYESRKEERLTYYKEYAKNNEARIKEIKRRYYLRNKDKCIFRAYRRKMAVKKSSFRLTKSCIPSIIQEFKGVCALSGDADTHLDHFIPISTGHGETSRYNLILLSAHLNLSKSDRNPFEWAESLTDDQRIRFDKVVEYLADLNGLTVSDYREFVFWCFENKRGIEEINDSNRDSLQLWKRIKDAA